MPALVLKVPGADFSGTGLGKFTLLPNIRDSLYAGYLTGTSYAGNPLKDHSGHGRDLVWSGNPAAPGAVAYLVIDNGGNAFTSAPAIAITGGGINAAATAVVSGGVVTGALVTNCGLNYTGTTVSISGGGGSGAAAHAVLTEIKSTSFQASARGLIGAMPFTGLDVAAANSEMTLVAFARSPDHLANAPVGNWTNTGSPAGVTVAQNVASTSAAAALCWATGMATNSAATLAAGAGRGAQVEMVAGSFSAAAGARLAYRGRSGFATVTGVGTPTAIPGFGGPNALVLGGYVGASYQYSAPEIYGALVYNKALTAAELAQVQARMTALFAAYGVTL
ncbi:hypothetical protein [Xanthobacter sp.]|uniref:hypothetical protein n=1 Tax=Xanthobacter sp. TaxID=35809 RepID=UPI0025D1430E|nr:hypothetical protein [Xanthobacter sp.]